MLDGTFLSAKTFSFFFFFFLRKNGENNFALAQSFFFSLFKPADEMRVNPRTCGRESSI